MHREELFRYIFGLLPHEDDAKDVLQETSVSLYRKAAEYDPGKPFLAWAYRFAYLEVFRRLLFDFVSRRVATTAYS